MTDIRPEELKLVEGTVDFLESIWPEYFEIRGYEHPVLGARKSLKIIPKDKEIDLTTLVQISVDFENDMITIKADSPDRVFIITNILKNKTVV